jgi:hypothetical protein
VDDQLYYQVTYHNDGKGDLEDGGYTPEWVDAKPLEGLGPHSKAMIKDYEEEVAEEAEASALTALTAEDAADPLRSEGRRDMIQPDDKVFSALYASLQRPVSTFNVRQSQRLATQPLPHDKRKGARVFSSNAAPILIDPKITKKPSEAVPRNRNEARRSNYWSEYFQAERVEMQTHLDNQTWTMVPRSELEKGTKIMPTKWVYDDKIALDSHGSPYISRFKARLTAMGNFQRAGIDFFDTFASVMRTQTFRMLIVIRLLHEDNKLEQWDVKAAFINAPFRDGECLYISQPDGHQEEGRETCVLKLNKALYGTRQAAAAWQKYLKELFLEAGFVPYLKDEAVYYAWTSDRMGFCIVGTHVDDMFPCFNAAGKGLRDHLWKVLTAGMTLTDEGDATWALKTKIQHDAKVGVTKISQGAYSAEMLSRFGFLDAKPSSTPAYDSGPMSVMAEADLPQTPEEAAANLLLHPFFEVIGCFWWLVSISRPDLMVAVHMASRYVNRPSEKLWQWLCKMMRYLKGTMELGLVYERPKMTSIGNGSDGAPLRLIPTSVRLLSGAADSSFADAPKKKTTLGHCIMMCGNLVDYSTKVSTRVLDSSTDAECSSLVLVGRANTWWRDILKEIGLFQLNDPTLVKEDNTSAIALTAHGSAKRSRHFDIAFFKLKDMVEFGEMQLTAVKTHENEGDFFTKNLPPAVFIKHRGTLMGSLAMQAYFTSGADRPAAKLTSKMATVKLLSTKVLPRRSRKPWGENADFDLEVTHRYGRLSRSEQAACNRMMARL